ncbi:hypothetical protein FRC06_011479 [Ceratobasidium sp. 370]|nr:hypothetical protein FRC06_011479 [Ceratobasidium sp. 370]
MSPLAGCPSGTVYVSATDARASYKSVQQAVEVIGNKPGCAYILVGQGKYFGTVNVTRQGPLTLLGEVTNTNSTANTVEIWNNIYVQPGQDNAVTPVLVVAPSFNASLIGSGPTGAPLQPLFGSVDFKAYNLNVSNLAANYSIGQALATDISYANASFYGCNFKGWQDTWYTGRNGSTYVVGGAVYGQTDCRPWNDLATTVYLNTSMDASVAAQGFTPWGGTRPTIVNSTFYAEYNSTGPGFNASKRISAEHILTAAQASEFTVEKVFDGKPTWIDWSYQPE